jgi:hypothetical protein
MNIIRCRGKVRSFARVWVWNFARSALEAEALGGRINYISHTSLTYILSDWYQQSIADTDHRDRKISCIMEPVREIVLSSRSYSTDLAPITDRPDLTWTTSVRISPQETARAGYLQG